MFHGRLWGLSHLLHGLAAHRAWVPGNQQRPQVPQPHLVQVSVRQGRPDLISRQSGSSVMELNTTMQRHRRFDPIASVTHLN